MRKTKAVIGLLLAVIALAFTVRDLRRVATVPRLSASLPQPFPVETVNGFRNTHPRNYAAHLSSVTTETTEGNESWYTDRSGYQLSEKYGQILQWSGKLIGTEHLVTKPFPDARDTHCFTVHVDGIQNTPVGIAFDSDTARGVVARPVYNSVYDVFNAKGYYFSPNAQRTNDGIALIGWYKIPPKVQAATVSLGIASRQNAVLYAEAPMRKVWSKPVGRDIRLRSGCPSGARALSDSPPGKLMITIAPPVLPNADAALPPYAYAVYAVDAFGGEHRMRFVPDFASTATETAFICDTLPRKEIVAVRVLVAPYFWTRFADVPVRWQGKVAAKP